MLKSLSYRIVFLIYIACSFIFYAPDVHASKSEAEILWEKGEKLFNEGRYREAISYYERSLSRCAGDLECFTSNYNSIGISYEQLGDDLKALSYYEKALDAARRANNKEYTAVNLSNAGFIYYRQAIDYEKAYRYLDESQKLLRELNKRDELGITLHYLGKAAQALARYDRALWSFNESLRLGREKNNQEAIAGNLSLIGSVYSNLGQYDKALTYYEEALKVNKRKNNPSELSTNLRMLGDVYGDLYKPDKAMSYYTEALAIQKKNNLKSEMAITYNNLGTFYSNLSQYEKAIEHYENALKIFREINNKPQTATILNNLGNEYSRIGLFDSALKYLSEAYALEQKLNRPASLTYVLNNLGMLHFKSGDYEKALYYLNESLKIDRKINNPHYLEIRLNNIGAVYLRQKRYREAENIFLERARLADRIKPNILLHPGLIQVYLETGRFDDALRLIKKNPPSWRDSSNRRFEYHTQLGLALKGKGQLKEASFEFLNALKIIEDQRESVGEREGFFGGGGYILRTTPYRELVNVLVAMKASGSEMPDVFKAYGRDLLSAAFYFSELTKARSFLETIAISKKGQVSFQISEDLRKREENLLGQLEVIGKQWGKALARGEQEIKRLQIQRENVLKEIETLVGILKRDYPGYALLRYPKPFAPDELNLHEDEVLIEFHVTQRETTVFVVKDKKVKSTYRIDISKDEMNEKIGDFLLPFVSKQSSLFSQRKARELYELLLSKAMMDLKNTDIVIIIPDGILGLIPFEALVVKEEKETVYVGDIWKVTYAQSATALNLLRMLKPSIPKKPLFALGNPIYNRDDPRYTQWQKGTVLPTTDKKRYAFRGITLVPKKLEKGDDTRDKIWEEVVFPPLPETEDEIKAIAGVFNTTVSPPDILLGIYANETYLRNTPLGDYRYIHFATHADLPGKIQGINEPFILLGQVGNKEKDDGFLTLGEVLGFKLNAEIVVLSACLTGRGKFMEGEGVVNFSRAFQQAGAKGVLVSLWEVPSIEAVEFMKVFYGFLKQGMARAEALRFTRQKIKERYPNPFYWAVFVLYGEG